MERLRRLEAFVRVAELASFSAAGRSLGLAQSQVSRAVRQLEDEVGSPLLTRNTRRVSLTAEGTRYLGGVRRALHELAEAEDAVRSAAQAVTGTLRVTAPLVFGDTLAPVLAELAARHSGLTVDAVLSDRVVDIIPAGFDVAIRSGALEPSTLRTRRLGVVVSVLVAAPSYLAQRGTPRKPAELGAHEHILFTAKPRCDRLQLVDAHARASTVRIAGRVRSNELRVVQLAALAGAGIAALPLPLVRAALADGRLQRLLPSHTLRPTQLHALFAPRTPQPARVTAFLEAVGAALRTQRALAAAD